MTGKGGLHDMLHKQLNKDKEKGTVLIPATDPIMSVNISPGAVGWFYTVRDIYRDIVREKLPEEYRQLPDDELLRHTSKEFYTLMARREGEDVTRAFYLPAQQGGNTEVETNTNPIADALQDGLSEFMASQDDLEIYAWAHLHPHPVLARAAGPSQKDQSNNKSMLEKLRVKDGNNLSGYDITRMSALEFESAYGSGNKGDGHLEASDPITGKKYVVSLDEELIAQALARDLKVNPEKHDIAGFVRRIVDDGELIKLVEDHSPVSLVYSKSLIFNCDIQPSELCDLFSEGGEFADQLHNDHWYGEVFGYLLDGHGRTVEGSFFRQQVPVKVVSVEGDYELKEDGTLADHYLPELEQLVRSRIELDDALAQQLAEFELEIAEGQHGVDVGPEVEEPVELFPEEPEYLRAGWFRRLLIKITKPDGWERYFPPKGYMWPEQEKELALAERSDNLKANLEAAIREEAEVEQSQETTWVTTSPLEDDRS